MDKIPRIALLVETSSAYGRRILAGVDRYLRCHRDWSIFLEQRALNSEIPKWIDRWRGDGIITRTTTEELVRSARRAQIPLVELTDRDKRRVSPRICSNDRAIGRLAAEHLLERGFQSFGFCGFAREAWSARRGASFVETIGQAGYRVGVFESPWHGMDVPPWESEQHDIEQWLCSLPKPVGIFASNDLRAQNVLNACREINVAIPEEIAVIGVDDDELLCSLCRPTLSSVIPNAEEIGYLAAGLLEQLMSRKPLRPDQELTLVEPIGVVARQSTDIFAIEDRDIAAAVRLIRENACKGITVEDILRQIPLSRSALERRFRQYLNRSPHAEIRQAQIKRVKQLLAETDLALPQIAVITGFEHPEYMSVVFKRLLGDTPGNYRLRVQRASSNGNLSKRANPRHNDD